METAVDNILPSILNQYDNTCKCDQCIEDIKALALNNLKPFYITTVEGYAYAKANSFDLQFKPDVVQQLILAMDVVTKNPRHL